MKKIVITMALALILITGCKNDLMNTPTKKVEAMLNNYITLNKNVLDDLDEILLTETVMTTTQKDKYRDILKKQYQDLAYEIKNETIDGDKATVEVEIEVKDFYKINQASEKYYEEHQDEFLMEDNETADISKYNDYKLDALEKAKDKVTYTLNLTLQKVDDKWTLDDLTDVEISKLHGLYAY